MSPRSASQAATVHERILILGSDEDGDPSVGAAFGAADLHAEVCPDMAALCRAIRQGAGAVLIESERLTPEAFRKLADALAAQPRWSDLPLIILAQSGAAAEEMWRTVGAMGAAGTVVILERPVGQVALTSALRAALRTRRRQYELREHLTEQAGHERALRESQELYRQLVESSPDAVFAAISDRIVYANSAALPFFDAEDIDAVIGRGFLDAIHPQDRPRVERRLRRMSRAEHPELPLECRWRRPTGGVLEVEFTATPLPWEGAPGVQVVLRDVRTYP